MTETSTEAKIIIYAHPACPMFYPVRSAIESAKVPYTYINIWEDDEARQRVREINNGNESVPTLIFPDGTTLTEPGTTELARKLKTMGYQLSVMGWVRGNAIRIITLTIIAYAILRFLEII